VFTQAPDAELCDAVTRMHRALRSTRGAELCIATVDADAASVVYAGAGNYHGLASADLR
jgi:hypothetical protein